MQFSELYKIMVNEVTFVGFRGGVRPNPSPLDPTLSPTRPVLTFSQFTVWETTLGQRYIYKNCFVLGFSLS